MLFTPVIQQCPSKPLCYLGSGGCATSAANSNADSQLGANQLANSFEECYDLCKIKKIEDKECHFFSYKTYQESAGVNCQMHWWSDLDRGSEEQLANYDCYKYDITGKVVLFFRYRYVHT